ncbi:MAG: zinc-binding dehydrogenase [Sulfolobales archaeon]
MKALRVHEPKLVKIDEVPEPQISDDEVLIKIKYAGICGTDLHVYRGAMKDRVKYPAIPGHEFSGVVVKVGKEVSWVGEGDEVVANPVHPCGRCVACSAGKPNICVNFKILGVDIPGVFAEYVKVKGDKVYKIPKGLSLRSAALVEPFSVAVHSCRKAGIEAGDTVVVIGQGPIGLCTTQVAKHYGAYNVIVVDVIKSRLALAKELGADEALNPLEVDVVKSIKEVTGGVGVDKVIETSGHPQALEQALSILKPAGRIVLVGLCFEDVKFHSYPIVYKEAEVVGSRVYVDEFPRTLNLISKGYLRTEPLITHEMPLSEGGRAFKILEDRLEDAVKILLRP